jgi:hypothetical protein
MVSARWWLIGLAIVTAVLVALNVVLSGNCVLEGELVDTPDGQRPIESLREGDRVLTSGPSGRREPGRIIARRESTARVWRELSLEGGSVLRATAAHPVSTERGWFAAGKLSIGDRVHTRDGVRPISAIQERSGDVRVFDLSVEPNPTFFASGVLVHNKTTDAVLHRRGASYALRTVALAQEDFRKNDRDNNRVQDYWVRDLAGLYYLKPQGSNDPLKFVDSWVAASDDAPARESALARADAGGFAPTRGYVFRSLTFYEDDAGKSMPYDLGDGRNPTRFGFIAFPIGPEAMTQPAIIINEQGVRYSKNLKALRIETFPRRPEQQGWVSED